jgi:CIC family chloride channel protein
LWSALLAETSPLDLRILGRLLLHAALVGAAAGAVGAAFFGGLEWVERIALHRFAGYVPLRAGGEAWEGDDVKVPFRWWILLFLPALGGVVSGLLTTKLAPETRGGGGDAMIDAFHQGGGVIRKRVVWVKALASIATLGTGGAGGREGPTMLIGGGLGSTVGQWLNVSARERRILLIAGVAAGISAVFRTPLGAALLATEVLYRDDFESDALVPALLASVVSYSVFTAVFGEATLFSHAQHYAFTPRHLPLYGVLAVLLAALAVGFVALLRAVQGISNKLPVPLWARPAVGGLALGCLVTPIIYFVGKKLGTDGNGLGILGGGYGAAQVAITGASWLPQGWYGVELLLMLCVVKIIAASMTIGTGGSAGDFAPCLALGGLFGGAFGRAVQLILNDPNIDPGAFALVGMGTLYGGIAHVPISSIVLVCELAGSYELLVPLMLAEGIAFAALRKRSLYHAQLPTKRDSPAHPKDVLDLLTTLRVRDVMIADRQYVRFSPSTSLQEMLSRIAETTWQDVFPVVDTTTGKLAGLVTTELLKVVASAQEELQRFTLVADVMQSPIVVREADDLRAATSSMLEGMVREVPVVDETGAIVGFLDEADIARAYLREIGRVAQPPASRPPMSA